MEYALLSTPGPVFEPATYMSRCRRIARKISSSTAFVSSQVFDVAAPLRFLSESYSVNRVSLYLRRNPSSPLAVESMLLTREASGALDDDRACVSGEGIRSM